MREERASVVFGEPQHDGELRKEAGLEVVPSALPVSVGSAGDRDAELLEQLSLIHI